MTIRKFKLPDSSAGSRNIASPKHPGDPKWITGTEWRKQREPTAMEIPRTLETSSRSFGLDNSSWGSVSQDADGSGWGAPSQTTNNSGWAQSDQWGVAGEATMTNRVAGDCEAAQLYL